MTIQFHIGYIKANGISASSALNVGTNILIGFGSNSKSINGNGSVSGDGGTVRARTAVIDDRDYQDAPCWIVPAEEMGPGTRGGRVRREWV